MVLAKIVDGDWKGWYGEVIKKSDKMTKLKVSTLTGSPLMIAWFNSDSVQIHNFYEEVTA